MRKPLPLIIATNRNLSHGSLSLMCFIIRKIVGNNEFGKRMEFVVDDNIHRAGQYIQSSYWL